MVRPIAACQWCVFVFCGGTILVISFINGSLFVWQSNVLNTNKTDLNGTVFEDSDANKMSLLLPSLPIVYWEKHRDIIQDMYYENNSCASFPNIFHLKYSNTYWQTFKTGNLTFELFNAYYDTRNLNNLGRRIQILAMIDSVNITVESFCQIWFDDDIEPTIVSTVMYSYIWIPEWGDLGEGGFGPYIVTCQLPESVMEPKPPSCVSLVRRKCDRATNMLRVLYDVPERKEDFAVCVKGLDFLNVDLSSRIVEWLEFLDLMGVNKVFFYELQVHPNIDKVLKYYQSLGKVEVTHTTLPGNQPNLPILQHQFLVNNLGQQCFNELIPYNDCFYRNMYAYKYIVLLDIDEIIMPTKDKNWRELLNRARRKAKPVRYASYNARNVYFLDDMTPTGLYSSIPPYMHMLRHTHRSKNFTNPFEYVKSFFDSQTVISVHNHMPMEHSSAVELSYSIHRSDAQLNHYRKHCADELQCEDFTNKLVQDILIWRHRNELITRVTKVLKTLELI